MGGWVKGWPAPGRGVGVKSRPTGYVLVWHHQAMEVGGGGVGVESYPLLMGKYQAVNHKHLWWAASCLGLSVPSPIPVLWSSRVTGSRNM